MDESQMRETLCPMCAEYDIMVPTPEQLAPFFHETYERLAPDFGYTTREASAKPWADVPDQNKHLMIAVAKVVLIELRLSY